MIDNVAGPWLRLVRFPAVFTALADIMAAYLYVWPGLRPWPTFAALAAASCSIYLAGMVLNDVVDLEKDRGERPSRPIPSGAIDVRSATRTAYGLLLAGIAFAALPMLTGMSTDRPWRSVGIAAALVIMVVGYDVWWKPTWFGPLAMGACRSLNWCLGMSTGVAAVAAPTFLGLDATQWLIVVGYGCYIAGVTWFARTEASDSPRPLLAWGLGWIVAGLILLSLFPFQRAFAEGERLLTLSAPIVWPVLLLLIMTPVIRRCLVAIRRPEPAYVQSAVFLAIHSIIVINAAICLSVRAPIWWAVSILLLLVPMKWLSRRIAVT